jgi:hypothetical protein
MDMATGIPGHPTFDAVLVVIDDLTKMTVLIPTSMAATTKEIFQLLRAHVFSYYGFPSVIKSDNGSTFVSNEMHELFRKHNITMRNSTVGHHTHLVERAIQTLRQKIRTAVDSDGCGWVDALPSIQLAINRSKTTEGDKKSPCERLFGFNLPIPLLSNPTLPDRKEPEQDRSYGWTRPSFAALIDNLLESRAKIAEAHDHGRLDSKLEKGSLVAVPYDLAKKVPMTWHDNKTGAKARPLFVGPCTVVSRLEGDNIAVNLGHGSTTKFHASVLKPLDSAAKEPPTFPGQPEELLWPDGNPKVRIVTRKRGKGKAKKYLVNYWGQHEIQGKWLTAAQVNPKDRVHLADYDRRVSLGIPSKFKDDSGLDLSAIPGTPVPPRKV